MKLRRNLKVLIQYYLNKEFVFINYKYKNLYNVYIVLINDNYIHFLIFP
jgi:hypothetical protein